MQKNIVDTGLKILLKPGEEPARKPTLDELLPALTKDPINSWEYAGQFRISLEKQRSSDKSPVEVALTLKSPYDEIPETIDGQDCEEHLDGIEESLQSPVQAFIHYATTGTSPPSYITIAIAQGFKRYLDAEGSLELEEVFFGKTRRSQGNYANRYQQDTNYKEFHEEVLGYVAIIYGKIFSSNTDSLTQNAENFLTRNNHDIDVDTFLRGYRRWAQRETNRLEHEIGQPLTSFTWKNINAARYKDGTELSRSDRSMLFSMLSRRTNR